MKPQTENQVEDAIITWLRIEGWLVRRQHVGTFYTRDGRPVAVGEPGECDWRCIRPLPGTGCVMYFEFEAKATGEAPRKNQREYMAKRKHQGIACIWADSMGMFREKYMGLFGEGRS